MNFERDLEVAHEERVGLARVLRVSKLGKLKTLISFNVAGVKKTSIVERR